MKFKLCFITVNLNYLQINNIALFFIFYFISTFLCFSQKKIQKGTPYIINYDINDLKGNSKIWDITQTPNGLIYLANNENLLEYNGENFKTISEEKSIIRSLYGYNNDSIYVGMDDNFGLYIKDGNHFEFQSLYITNKLVSHDIEEFWNVIPDKDLIIFQSFKNLYLYNGKIAIKIPARNEFRTIFKLNNQVYVSDTDIGIFKLEKSNLIPITDESYHHNIISGFNIKDTLYFIDESNIIFKLDGKILVKVDHPILNEIAKQNIFCVRKTNNHLSFGTVKNGLYVIDDDLNIIQHYNKKNNLLNNTVLNIFEDIEKNIWLGLDYGVSYIKTNDNLSFLNDFQGDFGTAYCAYKDHNDFYIGTNQGLYKTKWNTLHTIEDFGSQLPFSEGQVWNINNIHGTLFIGHDNGTYIIDKNTQQLKQISAKKGNWKTLPLSNPNYAISGNYNGIVVYQNKGGQWEEKKKLKGFESYAKNIFIDENDRIWVGSKTKGVFSFKLNHTFDEITDINSYSINQFNGSTLRFYFHNDKLHVLNNFNQHFILDSLEKKFIQSSAPLIKNFPEAELSILYNDQLNFIHQNDTTQLNEIETHLLKNYINNIVTIDSSLFIPTSGGFSFYKNRNHFNLELFKKTQVYIDYIESLESSTIIKDYKLISGKENSLKIHLFFPLYEKSFKYQYKLDNEKWSSPIETSEIVLPNLSYQDHSLKTRALYKHHFSKESLFSFSIIRPWYFSWYAYLSYFLLIIGIIGLITKIHQTRLKRQERILSLEQKKQLHTQEQKFKEESLFKEKKIVESENEQLKAIVEEKDKEIIQMAQINLNKNRVLKKVKSKFIEINDNSSQKLPKRYYNQMLSTIDYYLSTEDNKIFQLNFDKAHNEFFENIKKTHPDLTFKDLRVCAFVKMNLTSREIAPLIGISPSSVDVSRSRLRKKLKLSKEDNLIEYLHTFQNSLNQ